MRLNHNCGGIKNSKGLVAFFLHRKSLTFAFVCKDKWFWDLNYIWIVYQLVYLSIFAHFKSINNLILQSLNPQHLCPFRNFTWKFYSTLLFLKIVYCTHFSLSFSINTYGQSWHIRHKYKPRSLWAKMYLNAR